MASSFDWIGRSPDGETITLHKFKGAHPVPAYFNDAWEAANSELIRKGVVLDTETTGMNKKTDLIIEIGIREFYFNKNTGEFLKLGRNYSGLSDPSRPLSADIIRLTGLTNKDLDGKKISWDEVDAILSDADIILAHNASFDRPFIEKFSSVSPFKIWGCSHKQISWNNKGFSTHKLELLSLYHGFFTDAHRALSDADALLYLLTFKDKSTNLPYLNELLTNARRVMTKVFATNAPYDAKDFLRERSYYWDPELRVWMKMVYKDDAPNEVEWLASKVYNGNFKGSAVDVPFKETFKT